MKKRGILSASKLIARRIKAPVEGSVTEWKHYGWKKDTFGDLLDRDLLLRRQRDTRLPSENVQKRGNLQPQAELLIVSPPSLQASSRGPIGLRTTAVRDVNF